MNKNTKIGCAMLAYFVFCGFVILMHSLLGCEVIDNENRIASRLQFYLEISQHSYNAMEHWAAVKQQVAAEESQDKIEETYKKMWDCLRKATYHLPYESNESSATDTLKKLEDSVSLSYQYNARLSYQYNVHQMTKEQTDQIDLLVAEFQEKLSDEITHTVSIARAISRSAVSGRFLTMVSGVLAIFLWIAGLMLCSRIFYRTNMDKKTDQQQINQQ
jgi:predicted RND superfamily exporter protein